MFCAKCGAYMDDDARFCTVCACEKVEISEKATVNSSVKNEVSEPPKKVEKPKKKRKKVVGLIIFLLVFFGLIIGSFFFFISDFHRVIVAENCVISGDFEKAVRYLHDIDNDSADVLNAYMDVEYAREDFEFSAKSTNMNAVTKDFETFCKKVTALKSEDLHLLPDELLAKANCYCEAVDYIEKTFDEEYGEDSDFAEGILGVQYVMLNDVIRNKSSENGKKFTLSELKENMDITEECLEFLEDYDFAYVEITSRAVKENCNLVKDENGKVQNKVRLSSKTTSVMKTLIEYCSKTLNSYETYMDSSLEKFSAFDELFMKNPESGYKSSVGSALSKIDDDDDMEENTEIIINMIKKDVLYYLITGKTVN